MQENELRIGNLVLDEDGEVLPVVNIMTESIFGSIVSHNRTLFSDVSSIKGIPLTGEWMIKFGFDNHNEQFSIKTGWYYGLGQVKKQTSLKIKHTKANNYFVISPANGSIYIKYVHQLQNLYFALTGEELTK